MMMTNAAPPPAAMATIGSPPDDSVETVGLSVVVSTTPVVAVTVGTIWQWKNSGGEVVEKDRSRKREEKAGDNKGWGRQEEEKARYIKRGRERRRKGQRAREEKELM